MTGLVRPGLFLGGPCHGEDAHVLYGDVVEVPIIEPFTVASYVSRDPVPPARRFRYVAVPFTFFGTRRTYWVPEEWRREPNFGERVAKAIDDAIRGSAKAVRQ